MAGDIVKQLRDTRYPGQLEMRLEAADEIERLRGELDRSKSLLTLVLHTEALTPSGGGGK